MRKKTLWCMALLILLSGCHMEKASSSSPPPSPSLEAPDPTMTVTPTPEPDSDADRLKSGEDVCLYLYGATDLLAYTSYAQLKSPPEQVERYARCSLEHLSLELFCGEMTSILIFDGEKEPQELSAKIDDFLGGIGDLTREDVNFDGYADLRFFVGGGRGGQSFYAALLWEPETEAYVYAPSFTQISSPKLDPEHEVIWGGSDFASGYFYDAWEFIDGEFINTHSLIGDCENWAQGTRQCTEYARIDGASVEVGKREFPDGDLPGAVAAYIDSGPVWEGWTWCDPYAYRRAG